jgi:hypothetical protein
MTSGVAVRSILAVLLLFMGSTAVHGQTLGKGQLLMPLAPDMESRLNIPVQGADSSKAVWVVYQLVALSPDSSPTGSIDIEGSFEGEMTPINDMMVVFDTRRMKLTKSAGTIQQLLERNGQKRSPEEWKALMGPEMFAAYEAVNAGTGRVAEETLTKTLPSLSKGAGTLQVSVERAKGAQPLLLIVTVGQGDIPASLLPPTESTGAYRIGYLLGIAAFGWLVMRMFRKKRED